MSKLLVILLFVVFSTHFIAEVFVENKNLQRVLNNFAFVVMGLFFLIGIVGVFIFGA